MYHLEPCNKSYIRDLLT